MSFLIWLLLAGGGFLIYAGLKNKSPLTLIKQTLQGK